MKAPQFIIVFVLAVFVSTFAYAQETSRKRIPIVVSHLSEDNKSLLRRKGAPRHTIFSRVLCFKKKCRSYVGWRTRQRKTRFKGYKKGGIIQPLPAKPQPLPLPDSVITSRQTQAPTEATRSPEPVAQPARIFVLDEVLFEVNSAQLNEKFTYRLDSLVDMLRKFKYLKASISGHTDNTGKEHHNVKLSLDRAGAVADYLVQNNIAEDRISFEGKGSSVPIASNDTAAGRRKNRRVEIKLEE